MAGFWLGSPSPKICNAGEIGGPLQAPGVVGSHHLQDNHCLICHSGGEDHDPGTASKIHLRSPVFPLRAKRTLWDEEDGV